FQDHYEKGERELLLPEVSELRNQLLLLHDDHIQKEAEHENEETSSLRLELEMSQEELEKCRNNLNSCLTRNKKLCKEIANLNALLENHKSAKHDDGDSIDVINVTCHCIHSKKSTSRVNHPEEVMDMQLQDLISKDPANALLSHRVLKKTTVPAKHIKNIIYLQMEVDILQTILKEESKRARSTILNKKLADLPPHSYEEEKLSKMKESLEKDRRINKLYKTERECNAVNEEEMDEVRKQVKAKTAEVTVCLQEEISKEGLVVSVCGVSLEYTDDGEVEQEENFEYNATGKEVIGGDLYEFQVTTGGATSDTAFDARNAAALYCFVYSRKRTESTLLDFYAHISIMFSCCEGGKEDFVHDASSNKASTTQSQRPPYGGEFKFEGDNTSIVIQPPCYSASKDFQDSPDDEEDTRSSHEYVNDLKEEYQERALLAKSKRHKPELRPTKDFEAKYNKVKAKLAILSSSASASKTVTVRNKGLIVEAYEWDEEEVSLDDNEMVEVKVLMTLAKDNYAICKEGDRNGKGHCVLSLATWFCVLELINSLKIPPVLGKKTVFVKPLADDTKVSIPSVERPWLSEAEGFILPNHDTGRILPVESQRNTTDPLFTVTDFSVTKYDSADESLVCSTPLPLLKKLDGVEPVSGPKTIKLILRSKSTFKAKTLKGIIINKPSSAPAKGNKSSSA
nr:hypothetical protein [Tanacetum cinerariifolium]